MLLKDYYTGMEGTHDCICLVINYNFVLHVQFPTEKVPSKLPDPGRLPLIDLAPTAAQEVPSSAVGSTHDMEDTSTVPRGGEGKEAGNEQQQDTTATATDTKSSKDSPKRR